MLSNEKQPEGIALLSIYGGEDDDMADEEDKDFTPKPEPKNPLKQAVNETEAASETPIINSDRIPKFESLSANDKIDSSTSPIFTDNSTLRFHSSSTPQPISLDSGRSRTEKPTIVDYGHDEAALSPEAEEGELVGTGCVTFGADLHMSNGEYLEQTSQGTLLTPSTQAAPPQSSGQHSLLQLEGMECFVTESVYVEETIKVSLEEPKDVDPLDKFLLPPGKVKCSDELQEKIIKFLSLKKITGRSFNAEVRNRKDYRNPDFLLHSVTYQDINQVGTCFGEDVFNPHGYDKSDYYDEIEADMKRDIERKEQEKKKNQKIEYISGGTQLGTVVSTRKVNIPIPRVSSMAGGGLLSVPAPVDTVVWNGRLNKKSKNSLPTGGRDSVSAATLSAANAGAGYTAFAQRRRREAEEKRSGDRKLDRRS